MVLSPKMIQGELVRKISSLVGSRIYNYPDGTPAVFKSSSFNSKTPPSPKMPYVAVDYLTTLNPFHQEKYEGWLVKDGVEYYGILETKIMQFVIKVYGSADDDTINIASEISSRLKMSKHRDWFRQFEVGLYSLSNPTPSNILISNEYRDVTSLTVSLSYVERYLDSEPDDYVITEVNINTYNPDNEPTPAGLEHYQDDPEPLKVETGDLPQS